MKSFVFLILLILNLSLYTQVYSGENNPKTEIGIEEKLGENIPLDIYFYDEYGKGISLGELMNGKPTMIALVYYRCPGICSPLLTGLADGVDKLDYEPGNQYNVITISFDPLEDHILAAEKKKNYIDGLSRKIDYNGWRFLTSDSINIARITQAVGWQYRKVEDDFLHGTGITVISPDGKIVRYLYGTDFLPFDMKMAITEASEGRVGTTIAKLIQICFSYDPDGRRYVLDITRISGAAILLILVIFFITITLKRKKKNVTRETKSTELTEENSKDK